MRYTALIIYVVSLAPNHEVTAYYRLLTHKECRQVNVDRLFG